VNNGDDVLWDWTQFQAPNLQLTAPLVAQVGSPVTVNVQQYDDNGNLSPAVGASVDGQTTDSSGNATLTFAGGGNQSFKATLADANRSNAAKVCVYVTSISECGFASNPTGVKDRIAPAVALSGVANHKHYKHGHGPRKLAGTASDAGGLFQVYFRLRRFTHNSCQWYSSKRSVFTNPKPHCNARFQRLGAKTSWSYLLPSRLAPGSYTLETKALDKSFNAARTRVEFTVAG
jgi:hypothetical protein